MQLEDLVLVSVDDHVVEPPDMFEGRVPARFADQAPRVDVRAEDRLFDDAGEVEQRRVHVVEPEGNANFSVTGSAAAGASCDPSTGCC